MGIQSAIVVIRRLPVRASRPRAGAFPTELSRRDQIPLFTTPKRWVMSIGSEIRVCPCGTFAADHLGLVKSARQAQRVVVGLLAQSVAYPLFLPDLPSTENLVAFCCAQNREQVHPSPFGNFRGSASPYHGAAVALDR